MAGSSTSISFGSPRKPPLPLFAASDIFVGAPLKFVEPVSASTSTGRFVQMVGSSNDKPIGVAYESVAAGEPVAVLDRGEWPQGYAGGSIQPGQYTGVVNASEAKHPVSEVTVKYPVLGKVAGASGTATWSIGVALDAANPNERFAYYLDPIQLSSSNANAGVLG